MGSFSMAPILIPKKSNYYVSSVNQEYLDTFYLTHVLESEVFDFMESLNTNKGPDFLTK